MLFISCEGSYLNGTVGVLKWFGKYLFQYFEISIYSKMIFFYSFLCPVEDYFSSYETRQSVGRANPEKNHLAHPQAELGLSHMWPE